MKREGDAKPRLSDHTPMPAESSPAKDLAHFHAYWKSRGGFERRGLFGLVFLLNLIITLLTSSLHAP